MALANSQKLPREDLLRMKLPLSDEDYLRLHEALPTLPFALRSVSPELDSAYDEKRAEIYDARHPGNNLWYEEIPWEPPLTAEEKAELAKKAPETASLNLTARNKAWNKMALLAQARAQAMQSNRKP